MNATTAERDAMIRAMKVSEIITDLNACLDDIEVCRLAKSVGVHEYSDGSVEKRLKANEHITSLLYAELSRRGFRVEILDKHHVSEAQLAIAYSGTPAMWSVAWNGEGKDVSQE